MLTREELYQFTGSQYIYQYIGFKFTDGVKYLAEKGGAFWFLDIISSYQIELKNVDFQIWGLKINKNKSGTITCTDLNEKRLIKQKIEYTDFPLDTIKLYLINGVLILTSEY